MKIKIVKLVGSRSTKGVEHLGSEGDLKKQVMATTDKPVVLKLYVVYKMTPTRSGEKDLHQFIN